ncbi:sulfite oxidase heme-binding subunit YedZ [Pseudomonadota bacterium]
MTERPLRLAVFLLCLLPFGWLLYAAGSGALGADPAETIMHFTGEWSLRLLVLTLLVSPLRQWTGWRWLFRLRRMLGLYTFFYACIHLAAFCHFYIGWTIALLLEELAERPYITVGFGAWLLMLPLAVTSTRAMQRRLGRNWPRLHRAVYGVAVLASCHLLWQARSDLGEALTYMAVFTLLLGWRLRRYLPAGKLQPSRLP